MYSPQHTRRCRGIDVSLGSGEWRLKAKWANKPGGGRFAFKQPLSGDRLKAFAAQMRGTIRGAAGGTRPNTSQRPHGQRAQAPHPNAPGSDDDIPF